MRKPLIAILLAGGTAFAGSTPKEVIAPAPEPSLWQWFAGGSVGYLVDAEEAMYHLHLGVDFPRSGSLTHSLFLEVGYTEGLETQFATSVTGDFAPDTGEVPILETGTASFDGEVEVVPLTFNYKLEGPITERVNWYVGAGVGAAFIDADYSLAITGAFPGIGRRFSTDDTVFAGQLFAGLVWEVTECCEIYGGARYIYLDDPEFSDNFTGLTPDVELDDALVEAGFRYNF